MEVLVVSMTVAFARRDFRFLRRADPATTGESLLRGESVLRGESMLRGLVEVSSSIFVRGVVGVGTVDTVVALSWDDGSPGVWGRGTGVVCLKGVLSLETCSSLWWSI
jgi:hypothetical protein